MGAHHALRDVIDQFSNVSVAVVGDVVLDEFIYGDTHRINPEAPVPVLTPQREEVWLGGAANTAANAASLGANTSFFGRIGIDDAGEIVHDLFVERGISHHLVSPTEYETTRKTRIVARGQQVIRVDREKTPALSDEHARELAQAVKQARPDVIIVSDYDKGVVTETLIDALKALDAPIIVDPKPSTIQRYRGVAIVKPNKKEALEASGKDTIEDAGEALRERLGADIIITAGGEGAHLFTQDRTHHVPTKTRDVYDVVGAGDTFIAALGLALTTTDNHTLAIEVANTAAGLAVEESGTAHITNAALRAELARTGENILGREELKTLVDQYKNDGRTVVFTNGCFDILHTGHVHLLSEAKKQGDVLVVAINTDESVKRLKGNGRPVNNEKDRAALLASLETVDHVTTFSEDTPEALIRLLEPDVHVKGGDYDPDDYEQMPEAKIVHGYGGRVHTVELVDGKSTTSTIRKLKG